MLNRNQRGFTLLEILTAIFFVSLAITAILVLTQQMIVWAKLSSLRLTAIYLVQEGIEIVRNIRDTNWLKGNDWDENLNEGSFQADYKSQILSPYNGSPLLFDGNFYNYSSGNPTPFKREIIIEKPSDYQIKVKVIVRWEKRGKHQFETEEILYKWVQ